MVNDSIEREISIAAPVERVWAALTEEKHVKEWFGDDGAEIDLRPGGAIVFGWTDHGRYRGTVETVEPPHRFAYRWAREFDVAPAPGNSTLVSFTLTPQGTDTVAQHQGNTEGWQAELDELREYVERTA
jgi:uncharacterized protein YndB with AHSA1/START domain